MKLIKFRKNYTLIILLILKKNIKFFNTIIKFVILLFKNYKFYN